MYNYHQQELLENHVSPFNDMHTYLFIAVKCILQKTKFVGL